MGNAALPGVDGTDVGGTAVGAVVDCGAAVACGVDVADDPQANSKTTKSRTIALGRYLSSFGLDLDFGTASSLVNVSR